MFVNRSIDLSNADYKSLYNTISCDCLKILSLLKQDLVFKYNNIMFVLFLLFLLLLLRKVNKI